MASISELFYLDDTGIHVPDLEAVASWLINEYKNIYGRDVVLTPDTQDGQWLGILAQAIHDTMDVSALVYNCFSPSTALRDALDKNVRINGIARKPATYSMCDVRIVGNAGTTIVNGTVKDNLNRIWRLPSRVVIPLEGEIVVTARADEAGDWTALSNTLTIINSPTRGWQSVTNENEATAGSAVESDAELRRRQAISVALPSQSVLEGMVGAVATINGVTRYRAYENDTNTTDANGIPGHSSCIVVEGGDAEEIAAAIHRHKTVGSGTYGDTTVSVYDKYGLKTDIKFQRPTYNRVKIKVTIRPLSGYSNTYGAEIKARLVEYINSLGIGEGVYLARLVPPILACNTSNTDTFDITSIEAAKDDGPLAPYNINVDFDGAVLTSEDLITVEEQG